MVGRLWLGALSAGVVIGMVSLALAHGGGLDAQGGHHDRKSGTYHFHRGPLAGRSFPSKAAATRALRELGSGGATKPKADDPKQVIKRASTSKKIDALIALLVRKRLITEVELAAELKRR